MQEAWSWINAVLTMVSADEQGNIDDPDTVIPFINGGTEGMYYIVCTH